MTGSAVSNDKRFRPLEAEIQYYDDRAGGLLSQHQSGLDLAVRQIKAVHPRFQAMSDGEALNAGFTINDARQVTALEHGQPNWSDMVALVESIASGEQIEPFRQAFLALKSGDFAEFAEWLKKDPSLVYALGTNGNSLLALAVNFGRRDAAELLIKLGADVNSTNVRGWTALHQAAGSKHEFVQFLLDHGADIRRSALGDGGTPLAVALFWGNRESADLLSKQEVVPLNLRVTSGCGRADLILSFFTSSSELLPEAGRHRGFYRPHTGFPVWHPTNDRQEIINEAFVYAARNGQIESLEILLQRGAQINADPYRGAALHWAVRKPGLETTINWLIEHGVDVNQRASFGGPGYGERVAPLHVAAETGNLDAVRILLAAGADPTASEDVYQSTAAGWAKHSGHTEVADVIQGLPCGRRKKKKVLLTTATKISKSTVDRFSAGGRNS
jgi:ankyrin repeat protein